MLLALDIDCCRFMSLKATGSRTLVASNVRAAAREVRAMLLTVAVVLTVLWLFGVISSYTLGGYLHILLVLAVIALAIRIIEGRRVV
jgi:hypothetical protein